MSSGIASLVRSGSIYCNLSTQNHLMIREPLVAILLLIATPPSAAPNPVDRHFEYVATLRENDRSKILGFASLIPTTSNNATEVTVELEREKVGAVRAWQVRIGTCASPGKVWGDSTVYLPLTASAKGVGKQVVIVAIPLPDLGEFHISIQSPRGTPKKVFVCSDFYVDD